MTNLEDEFKNRFTDEQVTEGIDSDALWDSVSSALDTNDRPGAGWSSSTIGLLLLSAFLVGSGVIYYYNTDDLHFAIQEQIVVDEAQVNRNNQIVNNIDNNASALGLRNNTTSQRNDIQISNDLTGSETKNEFSQNVEKVDLTGVVDHASMSDIANRSEEGVSNSNENATITNAGGEGNQTLKTDHSEASRSLYADASSKHNYSNDNDSGNRSKSTAQKMMLNDKSGNVVIGQSYMNENSNTNTTKLETLSASSTPKYELGRLLNTKQTEKIAGVETGTDDVMTNQESIANNDIWIIPTMGIAPMDRGRSFNDQKRVIKDGGYFVVNKPLPIEIGFFSGVNAFTNQYNNDDTGVSLSELRKSHKRLYGNTNTLMLYYKLKKDIIIGAGVEYNVLKSQFNLIRERLILESLGSQVVEIEVDPQSGDTSYVYEEQFAESIETRRVRHNNSLKYISIPIDISKRFNAQKFNYGFGVGMRFNMVKSQSGKLINQEDAITGYDGIGSSNQLYGKSFLSYHAHAYIEKSLNDNFKIRFNPSIRLQQHGVSNFHGLKNNTILFGTQMGIMYSF
ncbi:MAG: hypothetical protein ACI8U0_002394 [Flavobacteriales bacterium]|jgi:hypothetical protein